MPTLFRVFLFKDGQLGQELTRQPLLMSGAAALAAGYLRAGDATAGIPVVIQDQPTDQPGTTPAALADRFRNATPAEYRG